MFCSLINKSPHISYLFLVEVYFQDLLLFCFHCKGYTLVHRIIENYALVTESTITVTLDDRETVLLF